MVKKQIVEIDDNWLARLVSEYYSNNNFKPDPEPTKVGLCKYLLKHIELHEANKPKPEPVGYINQEEYESALRNRTRCLMFVPSFPLIHTGDIPLYTTPPKREPLSLNEIKVLDCVSRDESGVFDTLSFAHAIEQAHGIGTSHEPA